MQQDHIEVGRSIQKQTGKTFYLATRFLPSRIRDATHVLYAFFRIADEVVDDASGDSPGQQADRLEAIRRKAKGAADPDDPVLYAVTELRDRYDISDDEIDTFIDAMKTDIETNRYETFEDLEAYMRGSAAAVGVMMTAIMEPDDPDSAVPHAISLGKAFQMTNFLRDVREDIEDRNRIYLPIEDLRRHDVSPEEIERLEMSDAFAQLMAEQLARTESLYRNGVAGIRHLPLDCQFPVTLAAVLYAEHHRAIRGQGYDVLTSRPTVSRTRKLWCLLRTRWHWHWSRDPVAVFDRVSAVSTAEADSWGLEHGDRVPTQ